MVRFVRVLIETAPEIARGFLGRALWVSRVAETVRMAVRTTVILSALGSRWDHLVQEVRDGQRSASTTTEAEDYGRKDSTGISGSGGYEHKERSQVAERSVAVGEE